MAEGYTLKHLIARSSHLPPKGDDPRPGDPPKTPAPAPAVPEADASGGT